MAARLLVWVLRLTGVVELLALVSAAMPRSWMQAGHEAAGLGELPAGPVVGYLARSASLMYAVHGAIVLLAATDPVKYRTLIRLVAVAALLQGAALLAIDLSEGLPVWWAAAEAGWYAGFGVVVLLLQSAARRPV